MPRRWYTIAAPVDPTVATAPSRSARIPAQWPGTITVRSACTRKSVDRGGKRLVHRGDDGLLVLAGEQPAQRAGQRPGVDDADGVRLGQQVRHRIGPAPTSWPPSQTMARDALAASTPDPGGSSESIDSRSRHPAPLSRTANPKALHRGLPSGPRTPTRLGRPGRSSHAEATRCHLTCQGRFDEFGPRHRRCPIGTGVRARARGPRRRSALPRECHLEDKTQPTFVDTVAFVSRLTSRTPRPPLAELRNRCGTEVLEHQVDFAQQVDSQVPPRRRRRRRGGRSAVTGSGRTRLHRTGRLAAQAVDEPRQDHRRHRAAVALRRPAAAGRADPPERRGGHRGCGPIGSPRRAEQIARRIFARSASRAAVTSVAERACGSSVAWPGYHGSPFAASATTRRAPLPAVSPHTSASRREVADRQRAQTPVGALTQRCGQPDRHPRRLGMHGSAVRRAPPGAGSRDRRWRLDRLPGGGPGGQRGDRSRWRCEVVATATA